MINVVFLVGFLAFVMLNEQRRVALTEISGALPLHDLQLNQAFRAQRTLHRYSENMS